MKTWWCGGYFTLLESFAFRLLAIKGADCPIKSVYLRPLVDRILTFFAGDESRSSQDMGLIANVVAASLLPITARCHRVCDVMGDWCAEYWFALTYIGSASIPAHWPWGVGSTLPSFAPLPLLLPSVTLECESRLCSTTLTTGCFPSLEWVREISPVGIFVYFKSVSLTMYCCLSYIAIASFKCTLVGFYGVFIDFCESVDGAPFVDMASVPTTWHVVSYGFWVHEEDGYCWRIVWWQSLM